MVVSTSDSNTTLVSLDRDQRRHRRKNHDQRSPSSVSPVSVVSVSSIAPFLLADRSRPAIASLDELVTEIKLPADAATTTAAAQRLVMPKACRSTTFLQRYESLADQRDVLLAQDVVVFDETTKETYVHVGQGEMATVTSTSSPTTTACDVLMSDRATTCHILAVWSSCSTSTTSTGTTSSCSTLTHIDSTGYDECIRAVFARHDGYHQHSRSTIYHVHIVGGYDEHTSHELSCSLLHCLADLAAQYEIVLESCVVAALNQDEYVGGPRLRGLALDCRSGRVYPAHCTAPMILGPVRGLRLWSRGGDARELLQLFPDRNDGTVMVIPKCTWGRVSSRWNALSDAELLTNCSTSPEYEDVDDFCHHLRSTFAFCNQVTPDMVFGNKSALSFKRLGHTNRWVPTTSAATTTTGSTIS